MWKRFQIVRDDGSEEVLEHFDNLSEAKRILIQRYHKYQPTYIWDQATNDTHYYNGVWTKYEN